MTNTKIRKTILILVSLIGITINASYGISLLMNFFIAQNNDAIQEILISAIALEFSWAALLFWVIFNPFERRHLLLFTAIPMLLGNLLHSYNLYTHAESTTGAIALNLIVGIFVAGIFVFAFLIGKPHETKNGSL